jgi:hypothetical protein
MLPETDLGRPSAGVAQEDDFGAACGRGTVPIDDHRPRDRIAAFLKSSFASSGKFGLLSFAFRAEAPRDLEGVGWPGAISEGVRSVLIRIRNISVVKDKGRK